jgi:hypothetical protein
MNALILSLSLLTQINGDDPGPIPPPPSQLTGYTYVIGPPVWGPNGVLYGYSYVPITLPFGSSNSSKSLPGVLWKPQPGSSLWNYPPWSELKK